MALRYEVFAGPLCILSVATSSAIAGTSYWMKSTMRTEGVVGLLFPWTSMSWSRGVIGQPGLRPVVHQSESRYRGKPGRVEMSYHESGDIDVRVEPPASKDGRGEVAAELRRETVDPLTVTIALVRGNAAGEPCNHTWRVFDGRVRYDLQFTDLGQATLEKSRGALYYGPAHLCEAVIDPIAGFLESDGQDTDQRARFRYWLAPALDGVRPMPVRLELFGPRGTLWGYLTEARTDDRSAEELREER